MITEKDIDYAREQEKLLSETYLKGIVDFMKWSSTLVIAAILWISRNMTSIEGLFWWLSIASLIFLLVSLVVAVFAFKWVLTAWAREWSVAREDYGYLLFKKFKWFEKSKLNKMKPEEFAQSIELDKKELDQIDHYINAINAAKPFSEPKKFNTWISWHIAPMVIGLLIYATAQILSRF